MFPSHVHLVNVIGGVALEERVIRVLEIFISCCSGWLALPEGAYHALVALFGSNGISSTLRSLRDESHWFPASDDRIVA